MGVTLVHRLFGFDGRVGRLGYLLFTVLYLVIAALPAGAGVLVSVPDSYLSILSGFALAAVIGAWGCLALTTQRLHDLGYSGLHTVWIAGLAIVAAWLDDRHPGLSMVVIAGLALLALGMVLVPGEKDLNRFGAPRRRI